MPVIIQAHLSTKCFQPSLIFVGKGIVKEQAYRLNKLVGACPSACCNLGSFRHKRFEAQSNICGQGSLPKCLVKEWAHLGTITLQTSVILISKGAYPNAYCNLGTKFLKPSLIFLGKGLVKELAH